MARCFLCAVAVMFAPAFAGTAFAAYDPSLLVGETNPALGRGGSVRIFLRSGETDDATGTITIYSPRGYRVDVEQPPGAELGTAIAFVRIGPAGSEPHAVQGTIRTGEPSDHAGSSCAPGIHEAVWLVELAVAGTMHRVPIYVDRVTAGAEAAHSSARMRICLASPYAPAAQQGVSVTYADLTIGGVFVNPERSGTYAWNAVFVPYTPGTRELNPRLTAQSTSYVALPQTFAVTARRERRGKAVVGACLRDAGQGIRGARVTLYYGGKTVFSSKKVAALGTNARGCVTARIRLRKTTIVFASAHVPVRQASGCTPMLAPRCSSAAIYPPSVRFRAVRVRR